MQKIIFILLIGSIMASCGTKDTNTIEGKKALLAEKNAELAKLQKEVTDLQSELDKLEPQKEKAPLSVTTLAVEKKEFRRFIDLQGSVATDDMVNASSEMGGRIIRIFIKEGQNVKKGQIVATTDAESLDKQKDEIKKALDLAADVYERQKRLWEQNIGSEVQYLQAKNNKERLEKSLSTIDVQSRKRNVYAPISGVVDKVFLKEGELAGPGTPIAVVLNMSTVKVVSDVPETYLGKVKNGDKVVVQFPALDKEMTQTVTMIGRTIDPSNRTFKMEVKLNNGAGELKPNLLSVVKINDLTVKDALFIPVDIIQQEVSGKKFVFVVKDQSGKKVASKAYITTGESADNQIIVTSGLSAGDQIIVKGARSVLEGQNITIESL
jgi:membrane fusion protein, multidrug efflux system